MERSGLGEVLRTLKFPGHLSAGGVQCTGPGCSYKDRCEDTHVVREMYFSWCDVLWTTDQLMPGSWSDGCHVCGLGPRELLSEATCRCLKVWWTEVCYVFIRLVLMGVGLLFLHVYQNAV